MPGVQEGDVSLQVFDLPLKVNCISLLHTMGVCAYV